MAKPSNVLIAAALLVSLTSGLLTTTPLYAQTGSQTTTVHQVGWGETLFSLAQHYGTTVEAICQANNLADPGSIYAGQRLVVPTSHVVAAPVGVETMHTVQAGENLYRLALKYGVTVSALVEINGLYNPDQVRAGQQLTIPGSAGSPAVSYQPRHSSTTHTVQRGETLAAIALRYSVPLWTVIQANNVNNPAFIVPGQTLVIPNPGSLAPPSPGGPPTSGSKRIIVDLSDQRMTTYQGASQVHAFVVSTGMPGANTAPGTYKVLDKYPNAYAYTWNLQMPYWLGIYWAGSLENGIHALPILPNGQRLWEGYLGTPVSYGCVILGTQDARTLYNWAEVGTPVIIQP